MIYDHPQYQEGKRRILEAVDACTRDLTRVRQPNAHERVAYAEAIDALSSLRGMPLYYPYIGSGLGNGVFVALADGSVKYDLISGIGVHYCGHSYPGVISAALDGAVSDIVMQGNLQQNGESLALLRLLTDTSGLDHCFLSSSGATACENALKICFQKNYPASRVLAFERAFAGRTLALAQITDKPSFREGLPETLSVDYIPFFDERRPQESTDEALRALSAHLKRYPRAHAVMCLELVQGEGGCFAGSPEFFTAIITALRAHHIAVWIDEVQTFARTEALFAFHHFCLQGLVDVVTIGKAAHACATLFTSAFRPKPGLLSQTFTASSTAIAVARYIIEYALHHHFFGPDGKIARLHHAFSEMLSRLNGRYPGMAEPPYGLGAMIAFTPFGGDPERVTRFVNKLFENGIIAFVAGADHLRVRFLPPVCAMELGDLAGIEHILDETMRSEQQL